jgi:hypothetical protein
MPVTLIDPVHGAEEFRAVVEEEEPVGDLVPLFDPQLVRIGRDSATPIPRGRRFRLFDRSRRI